MKNLENFELYKKREFCKAIKCEVQMKLDACETGSPEYEKIRLQCKDACLHTTHEFHAWLIANNYEIVKVD